MALSSTTATNRRVARSRFADFLPGYLSVREAAAKLGLSHSQCWRYVTDGVIPSKDTAFGYAILEADLANFERLPKGNPAFRTKRNPAKLNRKRPRRAAEK